MFDESDIVEKPIIEFLKDLGWEYVASDTIDRDYDKPFDYERLSNALFRLNPSVLLTQNDVDRVIERLDNIQSGVRGNKEFFNWLKNEGSISLRQGEKNKDITLIDYKDYKNDFTVTNQYIFHGFDNIKADIILFVNGIPLVLIECKTQTNEAIDHTHAINQILRYNVQAPQLFKYLAFCCATDGLEFRYGWTNEKRYFLWKNGFEDPLEASVKNLLTKEKILDFIQNFIIFETANEEVTKKIAMQQQYDATNKIVNRLIAEEENKGLIWHTQGSGKTLTMLYTAWKLKKHRKLDNPTIILIIDRLQLEQQFSDTFTSVDQRWVTVIDSQKELLEKIRNQSKEIMITTIQKFRKTSYQDKRHNIIIMIDEAHRTQYGTLAIRMRETFPNAKIFGFTGTPIDKGKIGRSTFRTFCLPTEKYLHKYSIKQSIEDGSTVKIVYEPRCTDEHVPREIIDDEFFKITKGLSEEDQEKVLRKSARLSEVLKSDHRIEKVAKDIAEHFKTVIDPNSFKAQVVAVDREACAKYKELLDLHLPPEYSKVIYTSSPKDFEPNNPIGPLLQKYHMSRSEQLKLTKGEFQKKDALPKILIVTDMLLTGFDAPIERVMYLDKPLRDHNLLQAIARTNRPYPGKESALIIDYVGIFKRLKDALNFEVPDIEGVADLIKVLMDEFKETMNELDTIFEGIPRESTRQSLLAAIKLLSDEEICKKFKETLLKANKLFESISPDPFLSPYLYDYTWYNKIHEVQLKIERGPSDSLEPYMQKTRKLIRESVILRRISENLPTFEIGPEYLAKLEEENLPPEIEAVELRQAIKHYIRVHILLNPSLETLSQRLEKIIQGKDPEKVRQDLKEVIEEINRMEEERKSKNLSREVYSLFDAVKTHLPEESENEQIEFTKHIVSELCKSGRLFKGWETKRETRKDVRRFIFDICYSQFKDKGGILLDLTDDLVELIIRIGLKLCD